MNAKDLDWNDLLIEPFVTLLLGARGEGKTALAHRLLEVFHNDDRDAYIMGFPSDKEHLLPEWMDTLPPTITREQWPEDSIVLIHEAHQVIHARRSMEVENLELDQLVTVSRHKNSDIIYDTQQSQRLDRNAVAAVDGILVRWPALMQEEFERRQVRPIIEDARDALSKYVTVHDEDDYTFVERREDDDGVDKLKNHVYVHADQFRGEYPHEVQLADHWSEGISTAYGDTEEMADDGEEGGDEDDSDDTLGEFIAEEEYRSIFDNALTIEKQRSKGWESYEVGASGGHIQALLSGGIIDYSYKSGNKKRFELVNPSRVQRRLDEYDGG